jgi:hypothetical protein
MFLLLGVLLHQPVFAATHWEILKSLHPASSKPNTQIKELISKPIEITGFTIVDEYHDGDTADFLLAQKPGSCIHDPLPSPNLLIHVLLPKGKEIPNINGSKITIHGLLQMSNRSDSAYELRADSVIQL